LKQIIAILMFLACSLTVGAQQFNPEKFAKDREAFVMKEAGLTQQEADKFFPLYNEMFEKQRAIHKQLKELKSKKPATEAACKQTILKQDNLEIQIRQIEKTYHTKFLTVLSASKLYDVLAATQKFYRQAFRKAANKK
jgi:hypothetical protein